MTVTDYQTPTALAAAKGTTWNNAVSTPVTPAAMAANQSIAVGLPANVAAAIGVPTTTKHVGTF